MLTVRERLDAIKIDFAAQKGILLWGLALYRVMSLNPRNDIHIVTNAHKFHTFLVFLFCQVTDKYVLMILMIF
jgi:hypothetical protein